MFVDIQSPRSFDSFLGSNPISYPRFPNSFGCHTSENSPVSPTIATDPKTHVSNPCICHTSETPRGPSHFDSAQLPYLHSSEPTRGQGRNPLFVSVNSAYSVLISDSFLRLSTSSIYPLSFHSLANSFALRKTLSHLFSGNSELFAQNTGGRRPCREMHDFKGADSAGKTSNGLNLLSTDPL